MMKIPCVSQASLLQRSMPPRGAFGAAVGAVGFAATGGLADLVQLATIQRPGHGEEGKTWDSGG